MSTLLSILFALVLLTLAGEAVTAALMYIAIRALANTATRALERTVIDNALRDSGSSYRPD